MKRKTQTLVTGFFFAGFVGFLAQGAEIIGDTFTVANSGSGFALGQGVNSGINPPTTRLTGTAAADIRYYQTATGKLTSSYDISSNRLRVSTDSGIGRFTLSANGSTPFDFGPALGSAYASPTNRATYDLKISMRNNASSAARFAFALGTTEGDANSWDFGVQLYRASTADNFYTIRKRIDIGSCGVADLNEAMGTTAPGTWVSGGQATISFLIRVTDAGGETNAYSSQVQVSLDDGATWIYDSATDPSLPNGWRLDGPARYFLFDQAGNSSGAVFYDNFSVISTYAPPPPAPVVWNGAGANDNWSTPENWGGTAPTAGAPLVFDGTARQANINDLVDLTVPSITFNNGGFSLSGNSFGIDTMISNLAGVNTIAGDFSWSAAAIKTWSIADGSELVLNNITTMEVSGDSALLGGGTLRSKGTMNIGQATTATPAFIIYEGKHLVDGGTFASRGGYRIGSQAGGVGAQTILTNGANFTLTVAGGNLRVGDSANPVTSRLVVDNSTLTMTGGNLGIPYAAGATGEVAQNGGTISGGVIAFSDSGAGTGTYTIKNGTLDTIQIRKDAAAGIGSIFFDNAILRTAPAANSAFFSGLDVAEIQSGGLTLDAQVDVTIGQILSGTGSLVKSNFATVTLTGANTYSGNTVVQAGKLVLPTIQTNATTVQVADAAELGVIVSTPGTTLSVPTVNLGAGSFSTLSFDLATFPSPTAPLMKVNSLSANGPVTVNVANGLQLSTGQIVLVDYNGAIGGGFQFTLGSLPPGVTATLVNNVANSSIDLNITGVPGLRWTGAMSGDWDGSTQNWIDLQNGLPSAYSDGYPTEFKDGASSGIINIVSFPTPAIISVSNNALPYVWSNGALTTPMLKKFGTNSLTRVEGGADFIDGIELNAGSFVVNNSSDSSFSTVLTDTSAGSGTFVKQGASTLTLATNNSTYDGAILVQQGILKLGTTNSPLGSTNGATTIASGATLDLNDIVAPHEPIFVSGTGVSGQGAIIDSATGGAVANNLTDVTLLGDTTFGSSGRWDLRVRSGTGPGPGLRGNGFNLTKVGSGAVSIACQRNIGAATPYWEMNLGDVLIAEGSITFAESLSLGNPAKTITVAAGASLGTYDLQLTNPIVRNIFMTDATITGGGGSNDTNVFTGSIQVTGSAHLRPNDTRLIINGPIVGTGSVNVSASGNGILYLNGINTYPGDTTVTNGILGGYGVIAGNLIMLDGTNAPGMGIGTLTVNGNATLAGTTLMELDRSQSPNSDRLSVGGSLNFGGTLTVVLGAGAPSPQAGDVYQLFNKGGSGSFAPVNLPDLSALPGGLAWDTSNLNVNGTISVTGTATSPTISSVSTDGNNLVLSGTGGVEGNSYIVLSSTNVATPVTNWIHLATNTFGVGGSFSYTNNIDVGTPERFFLLQVP